ncbi:MAG: Threonylcarbamoyladenosine tRNA methylthiotransferase MtaB [Lentisphaerae bacterium ADurb.Bin242]|nr:MAG: Threonylcarbamoyladenosine tRNA methylthiotransferase MtaB [Lentisphaerae bacterium ADurb.Bin242]
MITITAAVVTLGCRLNQADSALLSDRLRKAGFQVVEEDYEDSPNLIVVNSCSVTATASRKTRQALAAIRRKHPYAYVVLTGCAAEIDKEEAADSADFDLLLPNSSRHLLETMLERRFNIQPAKTPHNILSADKKVFKEGSFSYFPFKTRANLKIQEGCENFCTYCIVPYARGPERSRDKAEVLADFCQLVEGGYREIVIAGVNICNYKCGNCDIVALVKEMLAVEGNYRIRLSSTEPGPMIPALADLIAGNPKLCKFLHLPLQSGSDPILKAMGRKYTCEEYKKMVSYARSKVPNLHVGTDWIVGFPGETEALFDASCKFVKSMNFANLHLFPFSPRKGTPAAVLPGRISVDEMMRRLEVCKELKNSCALHFARSLVGTEELVLVERQCTDVIYEGLSGNYVRIRLRSKEDVAGTFCKVRIVSVSEDNIVVAKRID